MLLRTSMLSSSSRNVSSSRSVSVQSGSSQLSMSISLDLDLHGRTATVDIPGVVTSNGQPILNEFTGDPFHIAIARPSGSFEFTYGEIGRGSTTVTSDIEMAFEDSWALFCVHHYNQDGIIRSRSKLTSWIDA